MTVRREGLRNVAWAMGVRAVHLAKRLGIGDTLEHGVVELARRVVRAPMHEAEVVVSPGLRMVMPTGFSSGRTYQVGLYEPEVTSLVRSLVRAGMGIVDAGAFCGYYTLLAARLAGPSGRVFAFEAHPLNYAYLTRNIEANRCSNVIPVNSAVHRRAGSMPLVVHAEADRNWLSSDPGRAAALVVPTVSLDGFFAERGWPSVDLVLMDIEGAEPAALEGMRELSSRNPEMKLVVEFDLRNLRRSGADPQDLVKVLGSLGFVQGFMIERQLRSFRVAQAFPRTYATYNLLLTKG